MRHGVCPVTSLSRSYGLTNAQLDGVLAAARSDTPVTYLPDIDFWAVTRHADVKSILADRESYSASIALDPVDEIAPEVSAYLAENDFASDPLLVPNDDVENHARIRRHTQIAFGPKRLKVLEPAIRELAARAIDGFLHTRPVDLVAAMLYEFPAIVLFKVMGIDDSAVKNVKRWADNRLLLTFGRLTPEEQFAAARELVDYWKFSVDLVKQKTCSPGDDLPSMMLAARSDAERVLSDEEIANVVFGLLLAGHETTTNMAANAIQSLLENRESWAALVANPSDIRSAVEELIRYRPSVIAWRRKTKVAVEVAGTRIPAGAKLLLYLASGNRDESVFEQGEALDIGRRNARAHLSFGFGAHFCLGAPLARLELATILKELTRRLPSLRLHERSPPAVIETIVFRGPKELWVTW